MNKNFISLGLMSGTSGDGVDASIINSNGIDHFEEIKNKYFEYDQDIYKSIHSLKEKIFNKDDLKKIQLNLKNLKEKLHCSMQELLKILRAIIRIY